MFRQCMHPVPKCSCSVSTLSIYREASQKSSLFPYTKFYVPGGPEHFSSLSLSLLSSSSSSSSFAVRVFVLAESAELVGAGEQNGREGEQPIARGREQRKKGSGSSTERGRGPIRTCGGDAIDKRTDGRTDCVSTACYQRRKINSRV